MSKNCRLGKTKVLLGGAIKRQSVSKPATILSQLKLIQNGDKVCDYGCGYGFDANYFGWYKFDPYYFDSYPKTQFDKIVCINVLNSVTSNIRKEIIQNIDELLLDNGVAFLCVPRNLPIKGKLSGFERRPQNYVVLSLKIIHEDNENCIYLYKKGDTFVDKTKNICEN